MRRRRPDADEELLPLEVDEPDPEPGGRIVELGPAASGSRRRDLGILVAVVALVVAIGVLGDGGGAAEEPAEADATTTTAERRTTTTARRPRPTTTLPVDPIVTTTEGTGPVAPGTTTGSAIVTTEGDEVVVVDLDTGDECRIEVPGARNGGLWVGRGIGRRANVSGGNGMFTVTAGCKLTEPRQGAVVELLPNDRPGHVWEVRHLAEGVRLVEQADDGTETGRQIEIPAWSGGLHPVDGGFVTDVFGSVTFVDAATGQGRELADGFTITAGGDRVVIVDCRAFDCDLVVLDLEGRRLARRTTARPALGWQGGAISPDGRWFAYLTIDATVPTAVLLDLASGTQRDLGRADGGMPMAFTTTSSHLVLRTTRGLQLVPVEGGEPIDLEDLTPRAQPFALVDLPPG